MVKAINTLHKKEEPAKAPSEPSNEEKLLIEIRRRKRSNKEK